MTLDQLDGFTPGHGLGDNLLIGYVFNRRVAGGHEGS